MTGLKRQGIAKILQIQDQLFELEFVVLAQFFPGSASVEKQLAIVPARKRQTAKTQHDLVVRRGGMHGDFLGSKLNSRSEGRSGAIEKELRFAARDKPGGDISGGTGIDSAKFIL
jgi:hypothetical protein